MNITIIAGARPNFMKIAPLVRTIQNEQEKGKSITYRLIYTGKQNDTNLGKSLFKDLRIPEPDSYLEIESTDFFEHLANIIVAFAKELDSHPTDLVLVVDDMTPTMACSIVAKKKGIKVAHLVAGTRSFDIDTPKEVNRIITDGLSDYFFTAGMNSNRNLNQTGTESEHVYFVGNILIDTLRQNQQNFQCPDHLELSDKQYILFTLNRKDIINNTSLLEKIVTCLSKEISFPIIAPLHQYVAERIKQLKIDLSKIQIIPSQSYLQFGYLETHAAGIITDSGNIAEEATFLGIPCITLNNYVEHPETVNIGTNVLVGDDIELLTDYLKKLNQNNWKEHSLPERWDGHTAERIIQILEDIIC